ncbi:MAG: integrase domain-containing protein [Amphritea sp.]
MFLRVKPNGSKLWIFNYVVPVTGKRANLSFGIYPDVSLAEARERRGGARRLLAKGIDPRQHRDELKAEHKKQAAVTLEQVSREWFKLKSSKVTKAYAEDIIRSLENHILPKLGELPISKITAPLTIESLKPLGNSGKLEMVKRISQRLNEVMIYAVNTGIIHSNPLAGIRHAFETPKVVNNPTLKPDQLPELMRALSMANIRFVTRCLIEWQLHTMTRPSEAAGARWDEINVDDKLWVIPAERMKRRKEHVIPLTAQTLALLEFMRPISGRSPYLFPSDILPNKHANSSTANMALKQRMGFKNRLTAHGMRALASTALNEQAFDYDLIESALAHTDKNHVRATYNRAQYIERRRVMMDWWSSYIEEAAAGNMSMACGHKTLRAV